MKKTAGWVRVIIVGALVVISLWILLQSKLSAVALLSHSSSESARYLSALQNGQIPPRFDAFANNGFGDMRFTFLHPLKIWLGIPAGLLGLPGIQARGIYLMIIIAIFLWGLHQIDRAHKTRLLTFSSATVFLLIVAMLDLVGSDLPITLMTLPWIVWATLGFIKMNSLGKKWWSRAFTKEGLLLVLVLSASLLASSAMLALCAGLGLGVLVVTKTSLKKPLILCLFWACANTAWFVLPHYFEQTAVVKDEHSGNFITTTFDQKKANDIFDDYPNRTIISPNAAVKIIHKPMHWSAHTFTAIVPERSLILEKKMYVSGWQVKAAGKSVALENPVANAGLVAYTLDAGTHTVTSTMTQRTLPRMMGNSVSFMGITGWVWYMFKVVRGQHSQTTRLPGVIQRVLRSHKAAMSITKRFSHRRNR
jgi:hypothetical protein